VLHSGFCVSAARLGLPDVGLISYGEMVDQGRLITEAVSVPVIGDGDNGYGNSMNIKRTIKGYINAGLAGIMLEDQVLIDLSTFVIVKVTTFIVDRSGKVFIFWWVTL
jgi:2-methylisocitrate lyase-like PEP mutase family enzyme